MPSSRVEIRLFNQISTPKRQSVKLLRWAWSIPLAILLFAILWMVSQPGAQLAWTATDSELTEFRIYRSAIGRNGYELVEEMPANDNQGHYQFSDHRLIPGLTYTYIIEGITTNGNSVRTSALTIRTISTLASQFAILLTSFILTFGMITIAKELKKSSQSDRLNYT